ncbi:hypothetical protein BV22DRAFT_1020106 [Leucogyrophana mollusca]|uniref:Uncharacterized protein n=1 Tax=Leucogyrophana mollusca TaxID=85980 RepID=A0ACB8B798_9AGAM|nr:hypothetical protein BV22DRAFT_1020106 [Leucogyrophana mollusca]
MKFYFSTDHVRNSMITNAQGQVIYKVTTPFKPFWQTATSTVWKITPNSTPPRYGPRHTSEHDADVEPDDDDMGQEQDPIGHDDGGGESSVEDVETKVDETDMQDRFDKLATIEWHKLSTSRIRWLSGKAAELGEVDTKDFIPAHGVTRRTRIFTGPDGKSYRWGLGFRVCTLYLASDAGNKNPIARYHRFKAGLVRGKEPQHGYLEFKRTWHTTLQAAQKKDTDNVDIDNYTDYELERTLEEKMDPQVLDMILVTFIYCEKLRRDRERAGKKDLRWNF